MSWTFIGMLLLVIGLIAANLALLKHGSKKNQRPLKNSKNLHSGQQNQKVQAAATTAPVLAQDAQNTTAPHQKGQNATERADNMDAKQQQNTDTSGNDEGQT